MDSQYVVGKGEEELEESKVIFRHRQVAGEVNGVASVDIHILRPVK